MSSPYAVLKDRPLDQWKVTELKEELKKRRLTIKGLKEDLVKRLDEAVRNEREETEKNSDVNGLVSGVQHELPTEQEKEETIVSGNAEVPLDLQITSAEKVDNETEKETNEHGEPSTEGIVLEVGGGKEMDTSELEQEQPAESDGLETTVFTTVTVETVTTVTDTFEISESTTLLENAKTDSSDPNNELPLISENNMSVISPTRSSLQDKETPSDTANSTFQLENDESRFIQSDQSVPPSKYQVSKVNPALGFQVVSDSVSTESVSVIETDEIKVDVIFDNAKLELDIKSQLSDVSPDGSESHPMDVEEPLANKDVEMPLDTKEPMAEILDNHPENEDSLIDIGSLDPPEKLNLEDDYMDEDIVDTKQTESKTNSSESAGEVEKLEIVGQKNENLVDAVESSKETEVLRAANETVSDRSSVKRKFDKEVDLAKKPRRWNVEDQKGSQSQSVGDVVASATPTDSFKPTLKCLSRSDSLVKEEQPKDRVVPPSPKPPSSSLRIDHFLRPFTLKAVQELLGRTGNVTSFWMDNIKTHCYVSYSSVEEAVGTRNAVYNLQWPPNGGRLLVAEFVDPQEVKTRVDAPLSSPAATTPSTSAAHELLSRKQLPSPSLPAPPPIANPPPVREHLRDPPSREHPLPMRERLNLPPPTPLAEKVEPPTVTLDDLFRKTIAVPRIYYLPLSDEQVDAKLKSKGNVKQ